MTATAAALGGEHVAVQEAPAPLRPWFACAVVRSVAPRPAHDPLVAWVHANAHACLNVVVEGEVLSDAGPLPAAFVTGPLPASLRTWVPHAVRSLSLVFQPWLLEPLFGLRAEDARGRIVDVSGPAHPLLETWRTQALQTGRQPAPCWQRFWAAIAASLPPSPPPVPPLALDTLRHGGVAAAAAHAGCSTRHYRRRFERHVGLAPSLWLRLVRWEDALRHLASPGAGAPPLGEAAADAGYADQAHLSRETRIFSAASPARLRQDLRQGAASWSLQPARVRSVQDGD